MDVRPFYLVLTLLHIPIALMLTYQLFHRRWTSSSAILHAAFLSYWMLNGVRFAIYAMFATTMFADGSNVPTFIHALVIAEAILCLPLAAYSVPRFRRWVGLPDLAALATISRNQDDPKMDSNAKLLQIKAEYEADLRALYRIVRRATRETESQAEVLKDKEGMETVRQHAHETLEMLEQARQALIEKGGAH